MSPETPEQGFQLQVILGQTRDVIAEQQLFGIQAPTFLEGIVERDLYSLTSAGGMKLADQVLHFPGHPMAAQIRLKFMGRRSILRFARLGGIT